jgi:hypothetical protein
LSSDAGSVLLFASLFLRYVNPPPPGVDETVIVVVLPAVLNEKKLSIASHWFLFNGGAGGTGGPGDG